MSCVRAHFLIGSHTTPAAQSAHSNFIGSRVYACLGATCHLHFWQSDQALLHATAVKQGWNRHRIRVSTLSELWWSKFSRCSCWDSSSRPFDHKSSTLPTSYPGSRDILIILRLLCIIYLLHTTSSSAFSTWRCTWDLQCTQQFWCLLCTQRQEQADNPHKHQVRKSSALPGPEVKLFCASQLAMNPPPPQISGKFQYFHVYKPYYKQQTDRHNDEMSRRNNHPKVWVMSSSENHWLAATKAFSITPYNRQGNQIWVPWWGPGILSTQDATRKGTNCKINSQLPLSFFFSLP